MCCYYQLICANACKPDVCIEWELWMDWGQYNKSLKYKKNLHFIKPSASFWSMQIKTQNRTTLLSLSGKQIKVFKMSLRCLWRQHQTILNCTAYFKDLMVYLINTCQPWIRPFTKSLIIKDHWNIFDTIHSVSVRVIDPTRYSHTVYSTSTLPLDFPTQASSVKKEINYKNDSWIVKLISCYSEVFEADQPFYKHWVRIYQLKNDLFKQCWPGCSLTLTTLFPLGW